MEYFMQSTILNPYYSWWINLGPIFTHFYYGNYEQALELPTDKYSRRILERYSYNCCPRPIIPFKKKRQILAAKFQMQFPGKAEPNSLPYLKRYSLTTWFMTAL
jgi:hypothetical protein